MATEKSKSKFPLISCAGISQSSPDRLLFDNISLGLNSGDRIGFIGHNGCGKSTFLKILAGVLEPSEGTVSTARIANVSCVEQELPARLLDLSLRDAVLDALPQDTREWMDWKVDVMLSNTGFDEHQASIKCKDLSGGQMTRLMLARALMNEPNLLLLDEPSNHLDLPTLLWLEEFLAAWDGSFLIISHDAALLDKVTNKTWILRDKSIQSFELGCTEALQTCEKLEEAKKARRAAEEKEIRRVEASAKRIAVWGRTYDNEDLSRRAKSMEKQVDRMREEQTDAVEAYPWNLSISSEALQADRLLRIEGLRVTPEAAKDVTLYEIEEAIVAPGDRIALIGANGLGKSSLLKSCWARRKDEYGPVVFHPRCRLAFYDQSLHMLPDHMNLTDAMTATCTNLGVDLTKPHCERALISAGFKYNQMVEKVSNLSGGERSRLLLVSLSQAASHLMMLDEPTNHLDIYGRAELARQLRAFEGGFILVSHDRRFIEETCNRFFTITKRGLVEVTSAHAAYDLIEATKPKAAVAPRLQATETMEYETAPLVTTQQSDDEKLERLLELEELLETDLQRKEKRQSPHLQSKWRSEIETLKAILEI